ncbi:hypothetical protein IJJ12_00300 [bacterium]|nr:hypothetical protein [bacterium]
MKKTGKPRIIYSNHAHYRIGLRGLNKTSIEQTIRQPDRVIREAEGQTKYIKRMGARVYNVIGSYKADQHAILVVSAWVHGEQDPPDYLWLFITLPFRFIYWVWKWLFAQKHVRRRR